MAVSWGNSWWACQDLNLGPHPETKIARVPTGSAAREPSLAGPPDFHPSWRPRPWGSYQQNAGNRCAGRRFRTHGVGPCQEARKGRPVGGPVADSGTDGVKKARTGVRSWLACTHAGPEGGVRMTVSPDPGCSVRSTAVLQAHAETRARPVPAFSEVDAASSWVRMWKDRASSRRATATVAMWVPRRWASWPSAGANMGWRLAVWAASWRIPRTHTEPCLVMWPWRRVRSELRTWGVSPAQAHSLRAEGNRPISPISATRVIAVSLPTPGRA